MDVALDVVQGALTPGVIQGALTPGVIVVVSSVIDAWPDDRAPDDCAPDDRAPGACAITVPVIMPGAAAPARKNSFTCHSLVKDRRRRLLLKTRGAGFDLDTASHIQADHGSRSSVGFYLRWRRTSD
jgi:hypothetical protein